MSTFCGRMSEMDYISIDRFTGENLKSRAFFLSHCHSDHMHGLNKTENTMAIESALNKNDAYIYASPVTKAILDKMHPHISHRTKELDMYNKEYITIRIPNQDELEDETITIIITPLPAGHCPGSVMFLFETANKTLLYTGDIRIRAKELEKYNGLRDSTNMIKKIDNLYLDTTFFNSSYKHFPLREHSIKAFCDTIYNWLEKDEKNHVSVITPATYGSEFLFLEILKRCGFPIHVDQEKYEIYRCFPELDSAVTLDATKTRIHNYCTGYNWNHYICVKNDTNQLKIKPCAFSWKHLNENDCIIRDNYGITSVCYSSHSSYQELVDIIHLLKPLKITPCVVPKYENEKREMNELIDNILTDIHKITMNESSDSENDGDFKNKTNWTDYKYETNDLSDDDDNDFFDVMNSPESKRKKLDNC